MNPPLGATPKRFATTFARPTTSSPLILLTSHTPEDLDLWADGLRGPHPGQKMAVCCEQPRAPPVYAQLKYDFLILYPANTKLLKYAFENPA